MLIFPHINKTAGISLQAQILHGVAGRYLFDYHDVFPYGGYTVGESEQMEVSGYDERFDIVFGHFNLSKYKLLIEKKNTNLVCFLRDPVDRTISHYYYWKKLLREDSFPPRKSALLPFLQNISDNTLSLVDFASGEIMKNFYKIYLGEHSISDFAFIGITEQFDRSIEIINSKFDTRFYPLKQNSATEPKDISEILKYRADIKKANEENYHYYNEALKVFWNK